MSEELIEHLSQFITQRRIRLFDKLLGYRTNYITVVLEDLYQPHNASAVLRSCECFGIQDVHIIENHNEYRISPDVALGSHKWLSLFRYNQMPDNTPAAISYLKENGYRIVATTPHKNDCLLDDFDLTRGKAALLFGSELNGLSEQAIQLADEFVTIPMVGFTESLNISVTAAIFIHQLTKKLRNDPQIHWQLTDEEKQRIKLAWLKNSIRKSELIIKAFVDDKNTGQKNAAFN
jgi:tRNA (guanosine-2'-O-)-methyltransferase